MERAGIEPASRGKDVMNPCAMPIELPSQNHDVEPKHPPSWNTAKPTPDNPRLPIATRWRVFLDAQNIRFVPAPAPAAIWLSFPSRQAAPSVRHALYGFGTPGNRTPGGGKSLKTPRHSFSMPLGKEGQKTTHFISSAPRPRGCR